MNNQNLTQQEMIAWDMCVWLNVWIYNETNRENSRELKEEKIQLNNTVFKKKIQ